MGCVGNNKQIRIDSVMFHVSRSINLDNTVDATNIQPTMPFDPTGSSDIMTLHKPMNKNTSSTMLDKANLFHLIDKKVNENYKIIKPFLNAEKPDQNTKKHFQSKFFLVRHIETKNRFVMKIIKKTLIPRNNYFISFFSRVFTRIVHPNIIEYQDFYFDDINYYIIFDHSDKHNSTLKNQLDLFKNNFELKVKEVIQQVLNGLLHLHVLNIIYRNVALENILVSANNARALGRTIR